MATRGRRASTRRKTATGGAPVCVRGRSGAEKRGCGGRLRARTESILVRARVFSAKTAI